MLATQVVAMPGSARKFHSRHKFGKKRKKLQANNFKARLLARSVDDERDGSPAAAADASPSGPPACDAPDAPIDDTSLATERAGEHRDSASPSSSADSEGFAEPPEAANGELGLAGLTASDASQGSGRVYREKKI